MNLFPSSLLTIITLWFAISSVSGETRRYRVIWLEDPSTTAVIGWERFKGEGGEVKYRIAGNTKAATLSQPITRTVDYHDMTNCFARLKGLKPDTLYDFLVIDSDSKSRKFQFLTAPAKAKPFAFCAGGDSRNRRAPRQKANRMVAKIKPLFVAFTGDMINRDTPEEWMEWLDDWQLTITESGRIIPVIPHRGNHEGKGNKTIYNIFDTTPDNYYVTSVGGDLFRYYVLNSEMPCGGEQKQWLENDVKQHASKVVHLCAGYHKPMRPVVASKSEGNDEYLNWAPLFYEHGFDLVFESDSHAIKRTFPIRPSTEEGSTEGFITSEKDERATVYTGEGCWGAPLRAAKDLKPWIMAADSFNGIDWVRVYPDRMELRTIKVDGEEKVESNPDEKPMEIPSGIEFWQPKTGELLTIPGDGG